MNKSDMISINELRYREEDFGILMQTNTGGMHVVNETGIDLINHIKGTGIQNVDSIINSYLQKFSFNSDSESESAYGTCFDYLDSLHKLNIITVRENHHGE